MDIGFFHKKNRPLQHNHFVAQLYCELLKLYLHSFLTLPLCLFNFLHYVKCYGTVHVGITVLLLLLLQQIPINTHERLHYCIVGIRV